MRMGGGRYGGSGTKANPLLLLAASVALCITIGVIHNKLRSQDRSDPITAGISTVQYPFSSSAARLQSGIAGTWDAFFSRKDLTLENTRLQAEVSRLRLDNEALRGKAEESDRLRRLLKFADNQTNPPLPASVFGWLPSKDYETILIKRGSRDGVRLQSIVRTPDGLVGVVDDVNTLSASVRLLSDVGSQVHGVLYRNGKRTNIMGVVAGQGHDLPLQLRQLRREDAVQVGDVVLTTGFGGVYPPGIPVGKVVAISADKDHFLKNAQLQSYAPLPGDLREVLVLPQESPVSP